MNELNPSLHSHYRNFFTTTIQSATLLRIGSLGIPWITFACKACQHIAAVVSQVPFNSLCKVLVVLMPPALQPIIRLSLQYSYRSQDAYSFDRVCLVSTCHQRFAFAQLLYTYLMVCTTFSSSLTTTTFDCSSMKQFIHSACTACMRGLLSSVKQHVKELFYSLTSWHTLD